MRNFVQRPSPFRPMSFAISFDVCRHSIQHPLQFYPTTVTILFDVFRNSIRQPSPFYHMFINVHSFGFVRSALFVHQRSSIRCRSSPLTYHIFQTVCTTYIHIWYWILQTVCCVKTL
jgi:hypothetical protein